MVEHVDQQDQVGFLGKAGVFGRAGEGDDVAALLALRALGQVLDHVGLDIHGVDASPRHHVREAHGEIAGARADVGDHRIGLERERLDDFMGFLPCVALRIVEYVCPLLRC